MQVEFRSHFSGKKSVSCRPGNTVCVENRGCNNVLFGHRKRECDNVLLDNLRGGVSK